jgi:hypothetical protein
MQNIVCNDSISDFCTGPIILLKKETESLFIHAPKPRSTNLCTAGDQCKKGRGTKYPWHRFLFPHHEW